MTIIAGVYMTLSINETVDESKATVLIVDDNSDNLDVLSGVLRPFYKVKAAINGELDLKVAVAKNKSDIIILDIMMPGMGGIKYVGN
jgi:putative two-component system response regulator